MKIATNHSLKPYNTFGIDVKAKEFVIVSSLDELQTILKLKEKNFFILGGGSNMLLTKDLSQTVVKIELKGISILKEDDDYVWVEAQAGENWHNFVLWCLERNYGGLENLSLIPGNVGTTPIQNIGAYGVEIKDLLSHCTALHRESLEIQEFTNAACQFDYRESIFKNEYKDQYVIISAVFKLTKRNHSIKIGYGAIKEELAHQGILELPTIKQVSDAVIAIRQSKLPNPEEIGNSGSFFKNPIVSQDTFNAIVKSYPEMPFYRVSEQEVKIPAGWLIEQCKFKGIKRGNAGVHSKQALVLINLGNAKGQEIKELSDLIQATVQETFGINIVPEVNIF